MEIRIDSREKRRVIAPIIEYFDTHGIVWVSNALPVGDYMSFDNARKVIDRKQLAANCSEPDIKRFRAELERAKKLGVQLVILCEHGAKIKRLEDVIMWQNPVCKKHPLAMSGERLFKVLFQLRDSYGFEIEVCDKRRTGAEIVRILNE